MRRGRGCWIMCPMKKTGGKSAGLGGWRGAIDKLDDGIVELLGKRAKCALEIGRIKSKTGAPVFDPRREAEVMARVRRLNRNLPEKSIEAIYREIFSAARAVEKPVSVAYLGPAGTFSNEAAVEIFGSSSEFRSCPDFPTIFKEVEKGLADFGVLPVENTVGGSIDQSLDLLLRSPLFVFGEKTMTVRPNLASKARNIRAVKRLYSHPQPLGQCRQFIASTLPGVEVIETSSTTVAAERAAGDKGAAAICTLMAARNYKLNVLRGRIEDYPSITRFFVLSPVPAKRTGNDKTSIAATIKNKPGELYRLLGVFNRKKINLSKIVSRPVPGSNWEHLFFIDFDGHREDKKAAGALKAIADAGESLKILGSYPREK